MGFFSSSSPSNDEHAPNRSKRKQCWESRDGFFTCLDTISVDNALDPKNASAIKSSCSSQEKKFETDCATSWVKYFKEKRMVDIKKERFLKQMEAEGGQEISLSGKR